MSLSGDPTLSVRPIEPRDVQKRHGSQAIQCDLSRPPYQELTNAVTAVGGALNSELVKTVGSHLYSELKRHPGVDDALNRAVRSPPADSWPVEFHIEPLSGIESLPLESLYHPSGQFLAFDKRFSPVRVVTSNERSSSRAFRLPLRMTAVLAAEGLDHFGEWHALRDAIEAAQLPVELTIFLAEDNLEASIAGEALAWVKTVRVPNATDKFIREIEATEPQVLHFFTHGTVSEGGYLEVMTAAMAAGHGGHPLAIAVSHLRMLLDEVLLITLNACESGKPSIGGSSMAYDLVEAGAAAAIGAREVIDNRDANEFCRSLYLAAFSNLAQQCVRNVQFELNWSPYLVSAREALCSSSGGGLAINRAGSCKSWTLPVLYQCVEPVMITIIGTQATEEETSSPDSVDDAGMLDTEGQRLDETLDEINLLTRALVGLHPDTEESVVRGIEQRLESLKSRLTTSAVQ